MRSKQRDPAHEYRPAERQSSGRQPIGGGPRPPAAQLADEAQAIGDWLRFHADGTVELLAGKVEVGQGIRTSLVQAVAEELRLPIDRVRSLLGDTALTPYDMGTVGSRTTPGSR